MERARNRNFTVLAAVLGLACWVAGPSAAQTLEFATYHAPNELTGNPLGPSMLPSVDALQIPVGGTADINLFFVNDDGNTEASADPCFTGTGPEVCSVLQTITPTNMTIVDFTTPGTAVAQQSNIDSQTNVLMVTAANAQGFLGRTFMGRIRVSNVQPGAVLEVTTKWFSSNLANGEIDESSPTILAQAVSTCPNGVIDEPVEQCDDNNTDVRDVCIECRGALGMKASGIATGGTVAFDFAEISGAPVVVSTAAGENAIQTVARLVAGVNADPNVEAANIAFVIDPIDAEIIRTNGSFFSPDEIVVTDGGIQLQFFVPEPGAYLQLAACLLGLAAIARLKRR